MTRKADIHLRIKSEGYALAKYGLDVEPQQVVLGAAEANLLRFHI
jgi:hypothetical protein